MATALELAAAAHDTFPINGADYIEFYVGTANQAAHYYRAAFGFQLIGYRGPVGIQAYGHVVIAHRDTVIQSGDHVIVFCVNKKLVHKVEKLFQVGFNFL